MRQPSRYRQPLLTLLRCLLLALALPCVYFGGASAAFFYRQRALNAAHDFFSRTPAPTSATRLMVFAPHCDDETLGNAGRIEQTLQAGGSVRSVILTNGDGFRTAVERQVRDLRVGPSDYIQFAALRQEESYHALARLNLKHKDVLFLGYPDQGLMALWVTNWRPDHPFTSAYTRYDHSPYANTFHPHSTYCGRDLLADIKAALRAFRPTCVTVTHPAEDHPDHAAAAAFVALALRQLQADPKESAWAAHTTLQYYLVHRGDWPQPQGDHRDAPLLPPAEMAHLDTHWTTLPLTPQQTDAKAASIGQYASQVALMGRFLRSFARANELFGDIAPAHLATVPNHTMRVDGDPQDWEKLPPVLLDPVRDSVLRDLQGGGDVRALYACRDRARLYLRLDTRQPISNRITYTFTLRPFSVQGETSATALVLPVRVAGMGHALEPNASIRLAARGRSLEAAIPWNALTRALNGHEPHTLAVCVETTLGGVRIDRTGVRFLDL